VLYYSGAFYFEGLFMIFKRNLRALAPQLRMLSSASLRQVHLLLWTIVALLITALIVLYQDHRADKSRFAEVREVLHESTHASEEAANHRQEDINRRLDNLT
jgi:uncharacterized membrane protein (DUF106 family)